MALFLIINVALSFAYIRGGSVGSESVSTVALEGGSINVKYSSNSESIVASDIVPGYETTKKFTVTSEYGNNHEYYDLGLWYQINLVVDRNDFGDGSLTYSLSLDEASDDDGVPATNVEYAPIPSGQNLQGISVGAGRLINDNKSHIYNLKITYAETLTDQSEEIGSKFEAHITLTNPKIVKIIFDLDGGEISVPGYNEVSKSLTSATNSLFTLPLAYKSGYSFNGWEVVSGNATINGNVLSLNEENVTVKANYKVQSFATDTWEEIAFNVRHGTIDAYKLGDTREIELIGFQNGEENSNGLYTVRVANKNTPAKCEQSGFSQTACGFVVEFVDIIFKAQMNTSDTKAGGWPATLLINTLQTSVYDSFTSDLKKVIKEVKVVSGGGTTNQKIYLLNTMEVWGDTSYTDRNFTRQLDYYYGDFPLNGQFASRITTSNYSSSLVNHPIKKYNSTATSWWLTTTSDSNSGFRVVGTDGSQIYKTANSSAGVAPAFRIG